MILPLSFQLISSLSSSFTTSSSSFFLFPPFFFLHFHKNLNFTNKLLFELLTKSFRNNQFLTSKSVLLRVYLQKMSSTATSTQDSYSMGWVTCYRKDPPEEMQTSRGMLPAYYCHQPMVIYIANTLENQGHRFWKCRNWQVSVFIMLVHNAYYVVFVE